MSTRSIQQPPVHISVITATHQRPAQLQLCLLQFRQQSLGDLVCEHLVIADGPDRMAGFLAQREGARFAELDRSRGHAGSYCKDHGIALARGEYVCFWDDDNAYSPHALASLYGAVSGHDIGVVRARHRLRKSPGMVTIPRRWNGGFVFGDVDTMCVIVRRSLAAREGWGDGDARCGTDYRWLKKLQAHGPSIRYVPLVIGEHL